jgi:arginase
METQNISKFLENKTVGIVGVVIKEGQDIEGPEKAPEIMRQSGLYEVIKSLGWDYSDYQNVSRDNLQFEERENKEMNEKEYKYHDLKNATILGAANKKLHSITKKIAQSRQFCLTLGGDHGVATGSISGLKATYPDLKIIWIDAHADCNLPEDSMSGNYHGMPVAHLLGWIPDKSIPGFDWFKSCISPEDIVFIGLRDVDPQEKKNLRKHNIKCFSMHEVIKEGISSVIKMAKDYLFKDGKEHPIHVSFDVDGIDPLYAYGTGTKSRGGLSYREAHYILRELYSTGCLVGLDVVEINPLLDKPKEKFHGDNNLISGTETVALGIELIASSLGDTLV